MEDPDDFPAQVGRQLAQRRDDLDLTQEELAQRIGVTTASVSATERGRSKISRGRRADWERALKLRSGSISRAYRDGSPIQAAGSTSRSDPSSVEDLKRRMETDPAYAQWVADLVETVRRGHPPDDPDEREDTA